MNHTPIETELIEALIEHTESDRLSWHGGSVYPFLFWAIAYTDHTEGDGTFRIHQLSRSAVVDLRVSDFGGSTAIIRTSPLEPGKVDDDPLFRLLDAVRENCNRNEIAAARGALRALKESVPKTEGKPSLWRRFLRWWGCET